MSLKFGKLRNKQTCSIILIEPASVLRHTMFEILKDFKYERVKSVATTKEAFQLLEHEPFDWVIAPLAASESINALQILKTISTQPKLKQTFMTLIWNEGDDENALPHAFDLGLTSILQKSFAKDSLAESFKLLFTKFEQCNWDSTLVAAEYIRQYLIRKNLREQRQQFEESLLKLYPGLPAILYNLAESELALDHREKGLQLTTQVSLIDESYASRCRQLRLAYKCEESESPDAKQNVLALECVVVIDPDTDVLFHMRELLEKIGVTSIETFESGTAAFEWFATNPRQPDLVIMEWKIPGLTGGILIQRIRALGHHQVPIVVVSSLVKTGDAHIISEMGVDACVAKPIDRESFYKLIFQEMQNARRPLDERAKYKKIKRLLQVGNITEAQSKIAALCKSPETSLAIRKEIEAIYYATKGKYQKAADIGIEAIKVGGDVLTLLTLVGKSLLKVGDFERALKYLDKANSICPSNIERLLNIAEANIQLDRLDAAQDAISNSKMLDPSNVDVQQMERKVKIVKGEALTQTNAMNDREFGRDIISYMNNRAVALSRTKRLDDATKLYQSTVDSIPSNWQALRDVVNYNLALAYSRQNNAQKAVEVLEQMANMNEMSPLFKRVKSLREKAMNALSGKAELVVNDPAKADDFVVSAPSETPADSTEVEDHFTQLVIEPTELQPAEIGCYQVFQIAALETSPLLEQTIAFKPKF